MASSRVHPPPMTNSIHEIPEDYFLTFFFTRFEGTSQGKPNSSNICLATSDQEINTTIMYYFLCG